MKNYLWGSIIFFTCLFIGGTVSANAEAQMYRLYNSNSGEHFYTKDAGERNHLITSGWDSEGIGWIAPDNGEPVYRVYNANAGDHHYTMNLSERDYLISVGWKNEGTGWFSDENKRAPIYRAYNPNAKAGSHNYSAHSSEQQGLISAGWQDEQIGWYAVAAGGNYSAAEKIAQINALSQRYSNRNVNIYYEGLVDNNAGTAGINPDRQIFAASVAKLPIAAYVQDRINRQLLAPSAELLYLNSANYVNEATSTGGTGSIQFEPNFWNKHYTVDDLMRRLFVNSDNLASNQLLAQICYNNMEDFQRYINNVYGVSQYSRMMTAGEAGKLMAAIHRQNGIANQVMSETDWKNDKIGALPVKVDHKVGMANRYNHDAAVVYGSQPFILVVLGTDISNQEITKIAQGIYQIVQS
ncbi:serine hydrolase [Enterococcus sp. AZ103]|uniref:serine hydrolase n=1 Tax=Enterococcus sp. AZ103 TaxID=2774628 RepID=UPI003F1FECEF